MIVYCLRLSQNPLGAEARVERLCALRNVVKVLDEPAPAKNFHRG